MLLADLVRALRIAWVTLTLASAALLAVPFAVAPGTLARFVPRCEARAQSGTTCPLCGMTTAFYRIASGQFRQVTRANVASVPLFAVLVLNQAGALSTALAGRRRGRSTPTEGR